MFVVFLAELEKEVIESFFEKRLFWGASVFARNIIVCWNMQKVVLRISPYSVQMRENTDQKNSEYGHFSRSDR